MYNFNYYELVKVPLCVFTFGRAEPLTDVAFIDPKNELILPEFLSTVDIQAILNGDEPVTIANYL